MQNLVAKVIAMVVMMPFLTTDMQNGANLNDLQEESNSLTNCLYMYSKAVSGVCGKQLSM